MSVFEANMCSFLKKRWTEWALSETGYSWLFFLSWGVWLVTRMMQETALLDAAPLSIVTKAALLWCIGLLAIFEILSLNRYGARDLVALCIFALLLISAIHCGDKNLIYGFVYIYCARKISFKKISKFTLGVLACSLVMILSASYLALLPDTVLGSSDGRNRISLGFAWPSRPSNYLLTISMLYIYCRGRRITVFELSAIILIAVQFFLWTDSRNPLLCTFVLVILLLIFKIMPTLMNWKIVAFLCGGSFILCAGVMVILTAQYDPQNQLLAYLNSIMSGRLQFSNVALSTSGFSLFGTDVLDVAAGDFDHATTGFLDSSYLRLLLIFGAIPFFLIVGSLTKLTFAAEKRGEVCLVACLVCVAVHGLMEGQLALLWYTPFLFLLGHWFDGAFLADGVTLARNKCGKRANGVRCF